MGQNGSQPKILGRVVITIAEGGMANLQIEGDLGPFTVYNSLKTMAERFAMDIVRLEHQPKVDLPPPGFNPQRM